MLEKTKLNDSTAPASEDFKETGAKYNLSKFEYDLYHEDNDIPQPAIMVRRIEINNEEKWNVMIDNKILFVIEANEFVEQIKFLRSVDGVKFLINEVKNKTSLENIKLLLRSRGG